MIEVCDDPDAAVRGIADGATVLIGGFGRAGMPYEELVRDRFIVGTPEECGAEMERYRARVGVNHFLLRLQQLPNVVVTPHTAYYTERMLRDTVEQTLVNCLRFERNRAHGATQGRDLVRGRLGGA